MKYDFDREISRQGTCSVKWEFVPKAGNFTVREYSDECFVENRLLPLWVADMDFPSPQPVIDALVARAQHGLYGYTGRTAAYNDAIIGWMQRRQGWLVRPEWIVPTPGVMPAINMAVRTFVAPGEKVIIQPPVYYPFFSAVQNNGGVVVTNPLVLEGNRYRMDFDDLEAKASDPQVKMLILCSPHNPVGRVWSREELTRLGEICAEHGILVVSDEIHGDLILNGNSFCSYGSLPEKWSQQAIICTAPSKTFNVAGLHASNVMIPNESLRLRFQRTLQSNGLGGVNVFGLVALEAAYTEGADWLDQLLDYLAGNFRYVQEVIARDLPQITVIPPEGTYLVWLDCRRLGLDKAELQRLMFEEARVYLDDGYIFGPEGEGFERVNIACPRGILAEALARIKAAIQKRGL